MSTSNRTPVLFDENESLDEGDDRKRTAINRTLSFVDQAGVRVVLHWHEPLFRFALSDTLTLRYVAVHLRIGNLATQEEIAEAFDHSVATQRRWENRYQMHGLDGLRSGKSSGRPSGIPETLDGVLRKWFAEGVSNRAMAERLKVGEATIHRALARLGLHRRRRPAAELPWPDESERAAKGEETSVADGEREVAGAEAHERQPSTTAERFAEAGSKDSEELGCQGGAMETGEASGCEEALGKGMEREEGRAGQGPPRTETCARSEESVGRSPVFGEFLEDVLAEYAEQGFTLDRDPDNRAFDRALARVGKLEDALPLFGDRACQRQGGVLLAVPFLVESGLLEAFASTYRSLAPAFYGLRTTVVVLFLAALLRIKRPEHFKEHNPQELGHVVGLDRLPEVKTVHRKLDQLAAKKLAREVMRAMAERRIAEDPDRVAFLYVDGHVHEYYGQHPLAKAKKSQRQVAQPAATDNWVHDAYGEPLLVVTSEMNEGLTQVLEPILIEVKQLVGDRRPIVIFDRGGFSPKLFVRLNKLGFDVMTYRKGKVSPWPVSQFVEMERVVDGRHYGYRIAERPRVRVGRLRGKRKRRSSDWGPQYFWMREVRVLRDDGRQTAILTTCQELERIEVPYRQFNRWRQENYFKYMAAEFELDALLEYEVQDVSGERDRPNPARRPLERELAAARTRVQRLQSQLGAAVNPHAPSRQRTMRGFKIAHAQLRAELAEAEADVTRIVAALEALPRRVPATGLKTLKTEKKLIADTIKMTAYQVETRLLRLLGDHYCRTDDEGRTLLQAAFQSTARIEVREQELYVELAPQSSPHRTKAIEALCIELNALDTQFPGTRLHLKLAIQPHEPLTKA
jgi:transposase